MRPERLAEQMQTRPFKPFRIYLTDGRTYEIRHPDQLMVGRHEAVIGVPASGSQAVGFMEDFAIVTLLHITGTEPIVAPAPASN